MTAVPLALSAASVPVTDLLLAIPAKVSLSLTVQGQDRAGIQQSLDLILCFKDYFHNSE